MLVILMIMLAVISFVLGDAYAVHRSIEDDILLSRARAASESITLEQALAACVMSDCGILPQRRIRRPSRTMRAVARTGAACAAGVVATILVATPLVWSLAGSDVARAAAAIVRQ